MNNSPLLALGASSHVLHVVCILILYGFAYYVIRCRKVGFRVLNFLSTYLFLSILSSRDQRTNPSTNSVQAVYRKIQVLLFGGFPPGRRR